MASSYANIPANIDLSGFSFQKWTTSAQTTAAVVWSTVYGTGGDASGTDGSGWSKSGPGWDNLGTSDQSSSGDIQIDGYAAEFGNDVMFGLTDSTTVADQIPDQRYAGIRYCLYCGNDNTIHALESNGGSVVGHDTGVGYAPTDKLSVKRTGNTVTFLKNDSVIFTSALDPTGLTLFPAVSADEVGVRLTSSTVTR